MGDGRYISYWRLHDDASGVKFGDRIWVDISVNAEVCHDNDAFLDEAADVCLAEAEGSDGQSPFVGATAAEPILEGLDVAQETEHQDVTNTDSDDRRTGLVRGRQFTVSDVTIRNCAGASGQNLRLNRIYRCCRETNIAYRRKDCRHGVQ